MKMVRIFLLGIYFISFWGYSSANAIFELKKTLCCCHSQIEEISIECDTCEANECCSFSEIADSGLSYEKSILNNFKDFSKEFKSILPELREIQVSTCLENTLGNLLYENASHYFYSVNIFSKLCVWRL